MNGYRGLNLAIAAVAWFSFVGALAAPMPKDAKTCAVICLCAVAVWVWRVRRT